MATELATAYISIVAETSGIPAQIRQALGQAGTEADRQGRTIGQRFSSGFGSTMKGMLGAVGITAGIATVGAAMKSAISSGMDFTNSLNTMKAVSGATDQQLAAVSARARQLGTDNQLAATSSVDAAQAMLELSKGGMSVEQSMTAARGTLQLAAAAQISAAEAATIQSSALQTFGKDASYAGQTADILANAANQSSAEIVDVAYALQQGGTVANQFGVSMGDTAATVSLLANAGIKGSDAGTLMKSALLALTDTTDKQKMAAEQLGLTLSGNGVKFEGMQDLFTKLGTASKTMTREQYNNATSILFGSDAMRLAGVAATQGGEGYAKMAAAMMKQGAASDVAAAKMAGLPGAWEKLKNNAQDAGLAFYDAVQGPLTKMATWGSEAIGKIVDGFTSAGPKVKEAWDQVSGAVKDSGVLEGWGDRLKDIFASLGESVMNLLPTFGKLGELMGMASTIVAAVGIETFVTALESLAGVLEVGVVPIAQALNSVMSSMQPLVVAALAAFMGFRLVGPALAGVGANLAALQAKTVAAAGHMTSFASGWRQTVQWMRAGNPQLSALGASMRLIGVGLGTHVPTLQRMADAYRTTSTNASHFGRTLGVMNAGLVGARGGISKITDALGGGLSTALIAAGIAFMLIQSKNAKATAAAEAYNTAVKNVTSSQNDLYVALMKSRGAVTDDVYSAQEKTISAVQEKLDAVTKSTGSYLDQFRAAGQDSNWSAVLGTFPKTVEMLSKPIDWFGGKSFDYESQDDKMRKDATEAKNLQDSLADLGYNNETLTKAVYGSDAAFDALLATLTNGDKTFKNKAAFDLAKSWGDARDKFLAQQNAAKQVVPGITELGDAMQIMGDKSASASDKLSALKSAMDLLNPARSKTEAMAQYGEAIRKTAESIAGIDNTAFKGAELDTFTESGQKLRDTLVDLAEKSAAVATNGGDMGKVGQENQKVFEQLAAQTGKSVAEIKALYGSLGGDVVDLTVKLQGDTEVSQKLGLVQTAIKNTPKGVDIKVPADSIAGAESALKQLGIEVSKPKDGLVTITADSADAKTKLDAVVAAVSALPPGKQVAVGAPGGTEVVAMLEAMGVQVNKDNKKDVEVTSPLAPGVLQLLQSIGLEVQTKNGKSVIVTADDTDYQTKKKLGRWSETEYKRVQVQVDEFNNRPTAVGRGGNTIGGAGMGNADGSIRQYVDGGITALEAFANGGTRLPNQALIQKPDPKGGLVQWAEPSTKGEAFIPLADGKRTRSLSILSTVAKMFGYQLFPDGSMPDSLSGLAGGLAGGLVKHLVGKTGVDGITRFEDGGLRTAEEFRQLAEGGFGASQPLTGAPYNWGGVNWGDCCLIAETPVWGPDGVTPIAELQPGQRVWSYVDGKLEAHQVTAAWFSKTQETFKVRTRHRSVTGSANHPFLRLVETAPARPRVGRRGWDPAEYAVEWARLDELSAGDLLVQPKAVRLERVVSNSLPSGRPIGLLEAWLLGVILGDGNVSDTKVEICVYGDLRDRVRDILGRIHVGASRTRGERDGTSTSDSDAHGIRAYSTEFARELDEAGFRKPAHEKRIPDCVWGWDEDRQRAFLTGYCDADGHYPDDAARYGDRTYSSSSRALIEDVRYLHIALGDVVANVATNHRRKPITIKGKRVKNARPLHTISVRPAGETLVASVAAARRPGVAHWIDTTEFTVAPILDIVEQGVADTYDITVEGAHNFVAGGVVVHNSGAMAAFARFAAGLPPFGGRFSTATMAAQLQQMGAVMGNGPAGTMRFGWYNGGPGGGHAIGQLPDGANVEMGGANGGGMLGGTAGPDDAQFTDHAYFPVKATTTTDGSGDGTGDGTGNGSGSGDGSGDSTGSGEKTLSARLGKVAESFVSGQVASFMELLNVNDSPGWLAAIAEYENQQKSKSGNGSKLTAEQKQQLKAKYDQEKLDHKQDYDTEVQKLDDQLTAKQISRADYEQKKLDAKRKMEAADLKSKQEYDSKLGKTTSTDGGAKADYEQKKLDRKQAYDAEKARIKAEYQGRKLSDAEKAEQAKRLGDLKIKYENEDLKAQQDYERLKLRGGRTTSTLKPSTPTKKVRDPGTDKPRKDQDLPLPKLFDQGGSFGPGLNLVENKLGKPETGLPFSPDELKRSLEVGRGGDAQILAELRRIAELLARAPRGDNFDFRGDPDARRAQRVVNARNKAAMAGW